MSRTVTCECGKANLVDDGFAAAAIVYCIRCDRAIPLTRPAAKSTDPYGLVVPDDPDAAPPKHPAAPLEVQPVPRPNHPREFLYWVLPLALVPLAFSLGRPADDTLARFKRTLDTLPSHVRQKVEALEHTPGATLEDLFALLPGRRIIGAFLPRGTAVHWLYAAAAVAGFLALTTAMFTANRAPPRALLGVGLFTATAGVVILLAVQSVISPTYHDAIDDDSDFLVSLFGYVLGVGVFEELAKAGPLLWRYRYFRPLPWRAAALWGLASGVGFGVAEAVFYAERMYNGLSTGEMYLVRFASCVALHAIWAASVALAICKRPQPLTDVRDYAVYVTAVLGAIAVPAVLHGLYDVLLHYDQNTGALGVAAVSFGWLAWQLETTRALCTRPAPAVAPAVA
jgi:RsiW-degrading membrane proteinase PrsW (M82 family)